ncbi:hypothetical protein M427DRAFT_493345 [Gonapodya prolifera JEL478]|uniref:Uncharacterized protein n=1 Tax=Gonapodya prolifera (strain JEL478) TaxID=1344416 RepID=A0A139AJP2_GONPJ|nr:hypothetical protein M427DRAFT_493345 [Gonapodya prolifera JEL478]|eukprot:KXS16928.1 hypothetical protein M427DRAFT_493345 [Gonapodya prolifera JEL478]
MIGRHWRLAVDEPDGARTSLLAERQLLSLDRKRKQTMSLCAYCSHKSLRQNACTQHCLVSPFDLVLPESYASDWSPLRGGARWVFGAVQNRNDMVSKNSPEALCLRFYGCIPTGSITAERIGVHAGTVVQLLLSNVSMINWANPWRRVTQVGPTDELPEEWVVQATAFGEYDNFIDLVWCIAEVIRAVSEIASNRIGAGERQECDAEGD